MNFGSVAYRQFYAEMRCVPLQKCRQWPVPVRHSQKFLRTMMSSLVHKKTMKNKNIVCIFLERFSRTSRANCNDKAVDEQMRKDKTSRFLGRQIKEITIVIPDKIRDCPLHVTSIQTYLKRLDRGWTFGTSWISLFASGASGLPPGGKPCSQKESSSTPRLLIFLNYQRFVLAWWFLPHIVLFLQQLNGCRSNSRPCHPIVSTFIRQT